MKFYLVNKELVVSSKELKEDRVIPNDKDASLEKHVPFVKIDGDKVHIQVGETKHPMLEEHYISDVVIVTDKGYHHYKLHPGEEPVIDVTLEEEVLEVYEYCNLHGLWVKKIK